LFFIFHPYLLPSRLVWYLSIYPANPPIVLPSLNFHFPYSITTSIQKQIVSTKSKNALNMKFFTALNLILHHKNISPVAPTLPHPAPFSEKKHTRTSS
jgi:hypothetical protein